MADKDMTERNIITEKLPNAYLLICLFHTLRSFRREITTEKMGITAAQRVTVLDLISKLAYAQVRSLTRSSMRSFRRQSLSQFWITMMSIGMILDINGWRA